MEESVPSNTHVNVEQVSSPSLFECCWKFEEHNEISYPGDETEVFWSTSLRKCQSVGSGLDREGRFCTADTDDEIDQGLSSNDFQNGNFGRPVDLYGNSDFREVCGSYDAGVNLLNQNQENAFGINADPLSNCSTFSIGDRKQFNNEFYQESEDRSHNEFYQDGEDRSPGHDVELNQINTPHSFSKSHSLPCLGIHGSSPVCRSMPHRSMSVENLCTLDIKIGYFEDGGGCHSRMSIYPYGIVSSCPDIPQTPNAIEERVHSEADFGEERVTSGANKEFNEMLNKELFTAQSRNHIFENKFSDEYSFHNLSVSLNDWREPEIDGNPVNIQLEETSGEWHKSNSKNFNVKRVEEWIRQIDIHDSGIVQEVGESSNSIPDRKKDSHPISGSYASKSTVKGSGGVEAAYNYISSMAPATMSAQMANLGLAVIPFLSAFSSLRVLNLSCNAIVKITSGALPRGLHTLNLSRNNISTIEGLRELTRLRVLDLSYNRIVRIGHGLAACSSLKELHLAGNKISEVEGLHRLLKLNVLDLRFNKISTSKCLGQLAANYASLQAINLEGNPAQRNVGEEQLKRYLLSLLPHLVYFNKHIIRSSSTKDLSDRSTRSASSRQFDRGMRSSDHKHPRRGNHIAASHKATSSSNHFRVGQAVGSSPKPSRHRDRHVHLPPPASKITHLPRTGSKLLGDLLQPINPMRRSRSEGNLEEPK